MRNGLTLSSPLPSRRPETPSDRDWAGRATALDVKHREERNFLDAWQKHDERNIGQHDEAEHDVKKSRHAEPQRYAATVTVVVTTRDASTILHDAKYDGD